MKRIVSLVVALLVPLSARAASDPMKKVAAELGRAISGADRPRVGLLAFPYHDGKISSGSSIVSERLTTYFAAVKGIRVIERGLLKKLLEEQHLSETGVIDSRAAQAIGKVLGVDVLVTGTLIDLEGNETEVNTRALKAGTGEVIAARHAVIRRQWSDRPRSPNAAVVRREEETEEKPVQNEMIEIGYPAGRGGGRGRRF